MTNLKLILMRTSESLWSRQNKFIGWNNIELSYYGAKQSHKSSFILKNNNLIPNTIFSSKLTRSIQHAETIRQLLKIEKPINTSWYLNDRHYGILEGLNKEEAITKFGYDNIYQMLNKYYKIPYIINDKVVTDNNILFNKKNDITIIGESYNMVHKRIYPFLYKEIKKELINNEIVLIISHESTLKCIIKEIEKLNHFQFNNININHNQTILYNFNSKFELLNKLFLY